MATMLDQINTDSNVFFQTADFAQAATYTVSGGSAVSINVIFDEAFEMVDPLDATAVTTAPIAMADQADVPNAGKGDTILINSVTYYVLRAIKDGMGNSGITLLVLSRENVHG